MKPELRDETTQKRTEECHVLDESALVEEEGNGDTDSHNQAKYQGELRETTESETIILPYHFIYTYLFQQIRKDITFCQHSGSLVMQTYPPFTNVSYPYFPHYKLS